MGANQTSTQQSNSRTTADPRTQQAVSSVLNTVPGIVATPYTSGMNVNVANMDPQQLAAISGLGGLISNNPANSYINQANRYSQLAADPNNVNLMTSQFYNPMSANVMAQLKNVFGQQDAQLLGNQAASGSIGGSRSAVANSTLANQQGLAAGQTAANLYQQALNAAQTQQGQIAGQAFTQANLGQEALGTTLTGLNAGLQGGNQLQQQQQNLYNAATQNAIQRQLFPQMEAGAAANIAGIGSLLGGANQGVSTTTTPINYMGTAIGAGMLGLGAYQNGLFGGLGNLFADGGAVEAKDGGRIHRAGETQPKARAIGGGTGVSNGLEGIQNFSGLSNNFTGGLSTGLMPFLQNASQQRIQAPMPNFPQLPQQQQFKPDNPLADAQQIASMGKQMGVFGGSGQPQGLSGYDFGGQSYETQSQFAHGGPVHRDNGGWVATTEPSFQPWDTSTVPSSPLGGWDTRTVQSYGSDIPNNNISYPLAYAQAIRDDLLNYFNPTPSPVPEKDQSRLPPPRDDDYQARLLSQAQRNFEAWQRYQRAAGGAAKHRDDGGPVSDWTPNLSDKIIYDRLPPSEANPYTLQQPGGWRTTMESGPTSPSAIGGRDIYNQITKPVPGPIASWTREGLDEPRPSTFNAAPYNRLESGFTPLQDPRQRLMQERAQRDADARYRAENAERFARQKNAATYAEGFNAKRDVLNDLNAQNKWLTETVNERQRKQNFQPGGISTQPGQMSRQFPGVAQPPAISHPQSIADAVQQHPEGITSAKQDKKGVTITSADGRTITYPSQEANPHALQQSGRTTTEPENAPQAKIQSLSDIPGAIRGALGLSPVQLPSEQRAKAAEQNPPALTTPAGASVPPFSNAPEQPQPIRSVPSPEPSPAPARQQIPPQAVGAAAATPAAITPPPVITPEPEAKPAAIGPAQTGGPGYEQRTQEAINRTKPGSPEWWGKVPHTPQLFMNRNDSRIDRNGNPLPSFAEELRNNPALRDKALAISLNEQGDPTGNLAVIESAMNRAAVNHTTLAQELRWTSEGGYYDDKPDNHARALAALENPKLRAMAERNLTYALNGSNVAQYRTDNNSGGPGSWADARNRGMYAGPIDYNGEHFVYPNRPDARGYAGFQDWLNSVGGTVEGGLQNFAGAVGGLGQGVAQAGQHAVQGLGQAGQQFGQGVQQAGQEAYRAIAGSPGDKGEPPQPNAFQRFMSAIFPGLNMGPQPTPDNAALQAQAAQRLGQPLGMQNAAFTPGSNAWMNMAAGLLMNGVSQGTKSPWPGLGKGFGSGIQNVQANDIAERNQAIQLYNQMLNAQLQPARARLAEAQATAAEAGLAKIPAEIQKLQREAQQPVVIGTDMNYDNYGIPHPRNRYGVPDANSPTGYKEINLPGDSKNTYTDPIEAIPLNISGDDFVKEAKHSGISAGLVDTAKRAANYEIDPNKLVEMKGNERLMVDRLAKRINPDYNGYAYPAIAQAEKKLANGDTINSLSRIGRLFDEIVKSNDVLDKLKDLGAGDYEIGNRITYNTSASGSEYAKTRDALGYLIDGLSQSAAAVAKGNNTQAEADANRRFKLLNPDKAPDNLKNTFRAEAELALMNAQTNLTGVNTAHGFTSDHPKYKTALDYMNPNQRKKVIELLGKETVESVVGKPITDADIKKPVIVNSLKDVDNLDSGTPFIVPEGPNKGKIKFKP